MDSSPVATYSVRVFRPFLISYHQVSGSHSAFFFSVPAIVVAVILSIVFTVVLAIIAVSAVHTDLVQHGPQNVAVSLDKLLLHLLRKWIADCAARQHENDAVAELADNRGVNDAAERRRVHDNVVVLLTAHREQFPEGVAVQKLARCRCRRSGEDHIETVQIGPVHTLVQRALPDQVIDKP